MNSIQVSLITPTTKWAGYNRIAPAVAPHIGTIDEYGDFESLCKQVIIPKYADEYAERNGIAGSIKEYIKNRADYDAPFSAEGGVIHDIMHTSKACKECSLLYGLLHRIEKMHS